MERLLLVLVLLLLGEARTGSDGLVLLVESTGSLVDVPEPLGSGVNLLLMGALVLGVSEALLVKGASFLGLSASLGSFPLRLGGTFLELLETITLLLLPDGNVYRFVPVGWLRGKLWLVLKLNVFLAFATFELLVFQFGIHQLSSEDAF
jgi:hypothetical protein